MLLSCRGVPDNLKGLQRNTEASEVYFDIGGYSFNKYNLYFINDTGATEKQSFFIRNGRDELFQFIKLVKTKNPDFISKTWTHSFDFVDKYP